MSPLPSLTRRDFLNLGGMGLLGLFSPGLSPLSKLDSGQQGRVIYENIAVHRRPDFESERLRLYWKDAVVPITQVRIGGEEPAHNRIWYRIGREGYAHSSGIQPVRTRTNPVVNEIPAGGALAEVTVPYTDAVWNPRNPYHVAYRFYYQTTHWVADVVQDSEGKHYYHILEDKWDLDYYVPAAHLRLIEPTELEMISPEVPRYAKRIEVRTDLQVVTAYEWNEPVFMVKAATGADFSTGKYITPPGRHLTNYKRPSRHMAAGNLALNGYDLPGVPWITYITESGIAFHGTYWHNDFGNPRSHGCINLPSRAAKWLYLWTLPYVPPQEQSKYDHTATIVDVLPQ